MTSATFLTSGLLVLIGLLFIGVSSANLEPGKPLFPTNDERGNLFFGVLALACAFVAGLQL